MSVSLLSVWPESLPSLSFLRSVGRFFFIRRIDPRVRLPRCLLSMSDPSPPPCCSGKREGARRKVWTKEQGRQSRERQRLTHPGSLLPCRNSIYPHCFLISKNLTGSTHDAFSNLHAGLLFASFSSLSLFLSHPLSLLLTPRSTYASEETGVLARGWPELRHLRVISFLLLPFVMH